MIWAGHVACMGGSRGVYRVLVGKPEGKRPLGRRRIDGRIILKRIFKKWYGGHGLDWSGSGQEQVAGCCECGYEHAGNFLTS